MANFPTLSKTPVFPLREGLRDMALRSPFEAGYVLARPRFTRIPRVWPEISYYGMTDSDQSTLFTFEQTTVKQTDSFNWTHPETSVVYVVRFLGPVDYELVDDDNWRLRFGLEEI
jgi:hypothetical protein